MAVCRGRRRMARRTAARWHGKRCAYSGSVMSPTITLLGHSR